MKVKLLCVKGYNYNNKEGIRKEGITLDVCAIEDVSDSDGKGNFTFGRPVEKVFVPRSFLLDADDLINLVGKDVDLIYERKLGQRYDTLVDIKELK